ncbi:MAG: energy-coupling factor transporter ATPase [Nitrososphaerota archaeon]|nr:energy-coupling factor transporter ATPase [Candidatus Bathyarchaeota archaeon]MCX8162426.1 energy-coupling factor transporter ATPase [Candidatus Bathyarchaeota archaeon]MDW8061191.1 energy-coupling factor transporter ATPase [Nitrososphaerota archaeon]
MVSMHEDYPLILEDVTFTYEGSRKPALKDVDLKIRRGEITAVLGRTGAGKTTLIYAMGGVIPNYVKGELKGRVLVEGLDTRDYPLYELAMHVGVVMDDPEAHIVSFTVWEDAAFGPSNLGLPKDEILKRVDFALDATRLGALRYRNPYNLSGGEKQSLAIAGVLSMMPNVIALDEPTSMLDPLGSMRVLSVLKELNRRYGITVVLSSFDAEEIIGLADRIVVLDGGEVVIDGGCREVMQEVDMLERIGIRIPDVSKLSMMLKMEGVWREGLAMDIDEAFKHIADMLRDKRTPPFRIDSVAKEDIGTSLTKPVEPIIRIRRLSHIYPSGVRALRDVNLDIYSGEFVALIGQNGSGKTTLAKYLCGLLKPRDKSIEVIVDGLDLRKASMKEIVRKIGYVFQIPEQQLFFATVREEIGFGLRNMGLPEEYVERRVEEIIRILGLEAYGDSITSSLDRGKKFRVVLGSVIAMDPKIIVVDEPTTGQDWIDSIYVCRLLDDLRRRDGKTVIMITHEMELVARFADRVIVMHEGGIILDGTPRYVFSKPEILRVTWVQPPQITRLSQMLSEYGIPGDILSVEDMHRCITHILGGGVDGSTRV